MLGQYLAAIGQDAGPFDKVAQLPHIARIVEGLQQGYGSGRQPQRSLYAEMIRQYVPAVAQELDDELAETASALGAIAVLDAAGAVTHQI